MPVILGNADYASETLNAVVRQILDSSELCAMATVTDDGAAHINTAYFAFDDELRVYFLSNPDSLHCQNIERRPDMAIAVFDTRQPWGTPGKGLQLFGAGTLARGEAHDRAREVYGRRFPLFRELSNSRGAQLGGPSFHLLRLCEFAPARAKILDEERLGDGTNVVAEIRRRA